MINLFTGVYIVVVLLSGYGIHKLIAKYFKPRSSPAHAFLYIFFHFIAVFTLSFVAGSIFLQLFRFLFNK